MVTFGPKKTFVDFYVVYNHFCLQNLRPIQQKLEMAIFVQF